MSCSTTTEWFGFYVYIIYYFLNVCCALYKDFCFRRRLKLKRKVGITNYLNGHIWLDSPRRWELSISIPRYCFLESLIPKIAVIVSNGTCVYHWTVSRWLPQKGPKRSSIIPHSKYVSHLSLCNYKVRIFSCLLFD